jgi:hypothetical protein
VVGPRLVLLPVGHIMRVAPFRAGLGSGSVDGWSDGLRSSPRTPRREERSKFCHACGSNLLVASKFCRACGVAVTDDGQRSIHPGSSVISSSESVIRSAVDSPSSHGARRRPKTVSSPRFIMAARGTAAASSSIVGAEASEPTPVASPSPSQQPREYRAPPRLTHGSGGAPRIEVIGGEVQTLRTQIDAAIAESSRMRAESVHTHDDIFEEVRQPRSSARSNALCVGTLTLCYAMNTDALPRNARCRSA